MAADAQERGGRSWVSPAANLKMEGAKMTGLQEKQMAWLDRQEHYEVLRGSFGEQTTTKTVSKSITEAWVGLGELDKSIMHLRGNTHQRNGRATKI